MSDDLCKAFLTNTFLRATTWAVICVECMRWGFYWTKTSHSWFQNGMWQLKKNKDTASEDWKRFRPGAFIQGYFFTQRVFSEIPLTQLSNSHGTASSCHSVTQPSEVFLVIFAACYSQQHCQYLHMGYHQCIIWPVALVYCTGSMCFSAARSSSVLVYLTCGSS